MNDQLKLTLSNPKTNIANTGQRLTKVTSAKAAKPKLTEEEYLSILKYMQASYPQVFPLTSALLPLAVGIHKQILATTDLPFSKVKIRRFLQRYTRSRNYRKKLIVGSTRVNLQGMQAGEIKEEEVDPAKWKEVKAAKSTKVNHDSLIKKALENPLIAQEFLSEYLPDEYKSLIDLSTINVEKESFVEESLKKKLSDMVFSVQMRDQPKDKSANAFIYTLVEHQSYSDHFIAFRLLKYSLLLLERHARGKNRLPVILPLVIYNGKSRYKAPKNLFDLFACPDIARKAMTDDYNLIDLQAMDDQKIDYQKHLSFLLYTMKHIYERDTIAMLKEAMSRCHKAIIIDKEQNYILTKLILYYTDAKVPEEKKQLLEQLIVDNLPKEEADNIMRTIADSYIEEGFNKGMIQGIEKGIEEGASKKAEEIAKAMLLDGAAVEKISRITGLSINEIQKLV